MATPRLTDARRTRRSPRLAGYDYRRPGAYFVTVCTAGRACVFGEVVGGVMRRSALGRIAHDEWERTFRLRPALVPDAFVVMPNHVHLLFGIPGLAEAPHPSPGRAEAPHPSPGRAEAPHPSPGRAEARLSPTPTPQTDPPPQTDPTSRADPPSPAGPSPADPPSPGGSPAGSVPAIVGGYKSAVTRRARATGVWHAGPLWQARFHDRIVRDAAEADRIRRYILQNPARWSTDVHAP